MEEGGKKVEEKKKKEGSSQPLGGQEMSKLEKDYGELVHLMTQGFKGSQ